MHFIQQCVHGTVSMQCRCPGPKHVKISLLCSPRCPFKDAPSGPRFPPPGVNTNSGRGPER
jgi:hypothetical protein